MDRRVRRALVGGSLWLIMVVWQLVDLVGRLRDPQLAVDPDRLVLVLACVVGAVPVGSLLGGLVALAGNPARDPRLAAASTLQTMTGVGAYSLLVALSSIVAPPGSGLGVVPPLSAALAGTTIGVGVGTCALALFRSPRPPQVVRPEVTEAQTLRR